MSYETQELLKSFLKTLMKLNRLSRGSVWFAVDEGYLCVESVDSESDMIKGALIAKHHPSIVGWVIENGKMTVGIPGEDERHFKEIEKDLMVKSKSILCFPLVMETGDVYGAVQLIETEKRSPFVIDKEHYIDFLNDMVRVASIALSKSMLAQEYSDEIERLKSDVLDPDTGSVANQAVQSLFDACDWDSLDKVYGKYLLEKHENDLTKAAEHAGMDLDRLTIRLKELGFEV